MQGGSLVRQAEANSHQLGEIEDRYLMVNVHLELPGIQIHMAEGAKYHDGISSAVNGSLDDLSAQIDDDLRLGQRMAGTATGGFI